MIDRKLFDGERGQRDYFGGALAVGDFNADGYDDLVVGAPGVDWGDMDNCGAVYIIPGTAAGKDGSWFPILQLQEGFHVGVGVVLFHLTGGGLLLGCLLIAPDPVSTPLSGRGHLPFGVGVGILAFAASVNGLTPGGVYWAILGMNTLVPLIDRLPRRRV